MRDLERQNSLYYTEILMEEYETVLSCNITWDGGNFFQVVHLHNHTQDM